MGKAAKRGLVVQVVLLREVGVVGVVKGGVVQATQLCVSGGARQMTRRVGGLLWAYSGQYSTRFYTLRSRLVEIDVHVL